MPRCPFLVSARAEEALFDEKKVAALVSEWQRTGDEELFSEIVEASCRLIGYALSPYAIGDWRDGFEDLCHAAIPKLRRVLKAYDPNRGRVFSLFFISLRHFAKNYVDVTSTYHRRVSFYPDEMLAGMAKTNPVFREELSGILSGFRTRFTEPDELRIQKYILEYFLANERFPLLHQIDSAFLSLAWDKRRYAVLRNYVILQLRLLHFPERRPVAPPKDEMQRKIAEVLGPELYARVASLYAGMTFEMPGEKYFNRAREFKRYLNEEEGSEDLFYLAYRHLRRGTLEAEARLVPVVVKLNGEHER